MPVKVFLPKWRWITAVSGLSIALALMVIRSYELWRLVTTRPPGFYDQCCLEFDMWETKLLNSINFPALVLSGPVRVWWDHPLYVRTGFGILASDLAYLCAIGVFWWWVGRQFDQWISGKPQPTPSVAFRAIYYLAAVFGVTIALAGLVSLAIKYVTAPPYLAVLHGPTYLAILCVVWGCALSAYLTYRARKVNAG